MRKLSIILVVTIVFSSFGCIHVNTNSSHFPDYRSPMHYTLNNSLFSTFKYCLFLCRSDNKLIFFNNSILRHEPEFVIVNSLEEIADEKNYSTYYPYLTEFTVNYNYKCTLFDVSPFTHEDLSSWVFIDSTLLRHWPSVHSPIWGVKAGVKDGAIVYSKVNSDKMILGIQNDDEYTERLVDNKYSCIDNYNNYSKLCNILLLNDVYYIWFPYTQSFIILPKNGDIINVSLDELLKNTIYNNSVILNIGLVCDDGENLYLGVYNKSDLLDDRIILNYSNNIVCSIIKCKLETNGMVSTATEIFHSTQYNSNATMAYFQNMLLILSIGNFLDTIPIKTQ